MNKSYVRITHVAFVVALLVLGVQHFMFADFIAGRAPAWPEGIPGKTMVAYVTGLVLIVTSVALVLRKKTTPLLILTGVMILIWAGFRNLVEIIMHPEYGALLTNTMKALTMGSGAFVIANALPDENNSTGFSYLPTLASVGRIFLGLFLFVGGVQHFIFADFVKFLVPSWIPAPLFWTYLAGIALILAGLSLITRIKIQLSSLLAGTMVAIWLIVLHIPRAIELQNQNEWTAVCEALSVSSFLFAIYLKERETVVPAPLGVIH